MIVREKIEEIYLGIRLKILKDIRKPSEVSKMRDLSYLKKAIET